MGRVLGALVLVALASSVVMCGGLDSGAIVSCVAGASVACAGPGGCSGRQICSPDGLSFGPCGCEGAAGDAGAGDATAQSDARAGNGDDASAEDASASDSSVEDALDAPPFTPRALAGLALWLDGSTGIVPEAGTPGGVHRWLDQSGNGNDATQDGQEIPLLDPSALNAHDAIACPPNGSRMDIADSPTLEWGTGGYLLAMVVKAQFGGSGLLSLYNKSGATFLDITSSQAFEFRDPPEIATIANPNTARFHVVVGRGPNLELWVDGASATAGMGTADVSASPVDVNLCWAGGSGTVVELAEVIAVKGAVPDSDVTSLRQYLATKYKL